MKENEVLLINNFYIRFKNNTSVTVYNYDELNITKYYKDVKYDYNLNVEDNTDLCINGFGLMVTRDLFMMSLIFYIILVVISCLNIYKEIRNKK